MLSTNETCPCEPAGELKPEVMEVFACALPSVCLCVCVSVCACVCVCAVLMHVFTDNAPGFSSPQVHSFPPC